MSARRRILPLPPRALAAAAALALLAADGCRPAPQPAAGSSSDTATPAPDTVRDVASEDQGMTRLLSRPTSGYRRATELVVRDDAAWTSAWGTLHENVGAAAPPPAVDFARDMVVLVASGTRSTGGHTIRVDDVRIEGDGATVRYTVTSPGPGCMTTQMLTAPVEVVRVRRVEGTVRFERRSAVADC